MKKSLSRVAGGEGFLLKILEESKNSHGKFLGNICWRISKPVEKMLDVSLKEMLEKCPGKYAQEEVEIN